MGQVLKQDNIPNIVRGSSTTVTLAATNSGEATRVTVGGQQYSPSATLSLSTAITGVGGLDTGTIAANSTYYVYVVGSGPIALVASLADPATGPTGFFGSHCIGAFTTDNTAAVLAVIGLSLDIPGVPRTGTQNVFSTAITQTGSATQSRYEVKTTGGVRGFIEAASTPEFNIGSLSNHIVNFYTNNIIKGSIGTDGAWTLGQPSFASQHLAYRALTIPNNPNAHSLTGSGGFTSFQDASSNYFISLYTAGSSGQILVRNGASYGTLEFRQTDGSGVRITGSFDTTGAWTLGPSGFSAQHNINGVLNSAANNGAGSALPATPEGYLRININGILRRIPVYN